MTVLRELSLVEQARAVRAREVSPVDLVEHYLSRIDRLDASLGAYVTVTDGLARAQAAEAERAVLGADDVRGLPPLLGVPVPVKDLTLVRGVRATLGSAAFADYVAPVDDHVVTLLRRAGTVMLGKTNTPEFGLPCYTEPDVAPPARTPWDPSRSAGGSSGGGATAVAAGLAPAAQGNDGGGSIRIPASVCGLVGLKVSRGRVSNGPLAGDATGLAWHGALARTVEDAAALLDAMAEPMPGDPHWAAPLPSGETFLAHAGRPPGRLRIARHRRPVLAAADVHPDCVAAYESASALLAALGHEVEDVEPPFGEEVVPVFETLWSVASTLAPVRPEQEHLLRPLTRWLRERGRAVSGTAYLAAYARAQAVARRAVEATWSYDAMLTPTLASPPVPVGALRDDDDPAADFAAQKRFTPFTSTANVTGQPAVTLPLHQTADGLPIGVMLAGRPGQDALVLSLAAQVEQAAPWRTRHPPVW
ncbi:MAG: amidase [Actinomycetes bacterium]